MLRVYLPFGRELLCHLPGSLKFCLVEWVDCSLRCRRDGFVSRTTGDSQLVPLLSWNVVTASALNLVGFERAFEGVYIYIVSSVSSFGLLMLSLFSLFNGGFTVVCPCLLTPGLFCLLEIGLKLASLVHHSAIHLEEQRLQGFANFVHARVAICLCQGGKFLAVSCKYAYYMMLEKPQEKEFSFENWLFAKPRGHLMLFSYPKIESPRPRL